MVKRSGLQTRPGNASKHPGKVVTDLTTKRRSPAEVAAERAAIALAKKQKAAEEEALVKKIEALQLSLAHHCTAEMAARQMRRIQQDGGVSAEVASPIDTLTAVENAANKKAAKKAASKAAKDTKKPAPTGRAGGTKPQRGRGGKSGGGTTRTQKKSAKSTVEVAEPDVGGSEAAEAVASRKRGKTKNAATEAVEAQKILQDEADDEDEEMDHGGDSEEAGKYAIDELEESAEVPSNQDEYVEEQVEVREMVSVGETEDVPAPASDHEGDDESNEDKEEMDGEVEDEDVQDDVNINDPVGGESDNQTGDYSALGEEGSQQGDEMDVVPSSDGEFDGTGGFQDVDSEILPTADVDMADEETSDTGGNDETGADGDDQVMRDEGDWDVPVQQAFVGEDEEDDAESEPPAPKQAAAKGNTNRRSQRNKLKEDSTSGPQQMDGIEPIEGKVTKRKADEHARAEQPSKKTRPAQVPPEPLGQAAEGAMKATRTESGSVKARPSSTVEAAPLKPGRIRPSGPKLPRAVTTNVETPQDVSTKDTAGALTSSETPTSTSSTARKVSKASTEVVKPSGAAPSKKNAPVSAKSSAAPPAPEKPAGVVPASKASASSTTASAANTNARKAPTSTADAASKASQTQSGVPKDGKAKDGTTQRTARRPSSTHPTSQGAQSDVQSQVSGDPKPPVAKIRAWRKTVNANVAPSTSSSTSEVGSIATSLSPNDSISQVGAGADELPLQPRGRIDTPKKLGCSVGSILPLDRSSPMMARLVVDNRRSAKDRSRSRAEDEAVESRPSGASSASVPASSTAVNSISSSGATKENANDEESLFRKTRGMDVLVVEQPLAMFNTKKKARSKSAARGLPTLPHGVGAAPATLWRNKFVPTVLAIYTTQPEIWTFDPTAMQPILQTIWNVIFPGKAYEVQDDTNDPVFHQARQKVYDYRNALKKTAMSVFHIRTKEEKCYGDERIEFALWLLEGNRFVFENEETFKKLYRNPMIIMVLSIHYTAVEGALQINGLPDILYSYPVGSLILAATALSHVLRCAAKGILSERKIPEFSSNNCSVDTLAHAASIRTILDDNWPKIAEPARELATRGGTKRRSVSVIAADRLGTIMDEPDSD